MLAFSAYAVLPKLLRTDHQEIVEACHRQGITRIGLAVSMTGKLFAAPEEIRRHKEALERDGLTVFGMYYGLGHPAMHEFYGDAGTPPPRTLFNDGSHIVEDWSAQGKLLPPGWRYAVNEFGRTVYCNACPDEACIEGNRQVLRETAALFREIWYDDDYRLDGDQNAGAPATSTAACYCDACLASLSRRVGRTVRREDVLADQALHDAWIEQKTDQLATLWEAMARTAREVNPRAELGLMIRWGGEERDGIALDKLLPHFGPRPHLRVGEGHFGIEEYARPVSQVLEHLAASYHVSWFPREVAALSETTYFGLMPRESLVKKAALAVAAGAGEISYCACVAGGVRRQMFMGEERPRLAAISDLLADKAAMHEPIVILRGPASGRGDRRPVQRVRDRQPFPLFGLAGLCSTVVRQGGWRDTGREAVVAVTGRMVWDFSLDDLGPRELVLDGPALLEHSPLGARLGISGAGPAEDGRVDFAGGGFQADGLLLGRPGVTVIPYVWQDVPERRMPDLLRDIRRVVGPKVKSVVVEGDLGVLPVHYRHKDRDVVMLVNLAHDARQVEVRLSGRRRRLTDPDGRPVETRVALQPDEIRLLAARED